jgi:hypothetical protein
VDPPNDRNHHSFDRGDGIADGGNNNTIVIANLCNSGSPASPNKQNNGTTFQDWLRDNIVLLGKQIDFFGDDTAGHFITMDNRLLGIKADQLHVMNHE